MVSYKRHVFKNNYLENYWYIRYYDPIAGLLQVLEWGLAIGG
jgi:hypothetical protein